MIRHAKMVSQVGAVALVALLGASPVHAQLGNSADNAKAMANSKVSEGDREFMEDIAHANLAEISTGKMALEKSQTPEVKQYAQKMIKDHTTAQEELSKIAQSKGVKLPTETDVQHKGIAAALGALSGDAFDKQYIARAGVGDHERTHALMEKVSKEAKDPELKAYASKTIKVVHQHLTSAQKLEKTKQ